MKIVVLDSYTLNPGDLNWDQLKALAICEFHDRTAADQILPRARGAQIVLTNKTPLNRQIICALPDLRYIGVLATGVNVVDSEAAREQAIPVTNIPAYSAPSVAQCTFALLLELTQHVGHHAQTVSQGRWSKCPDFCYWDYPLIELEGLTLGLIGYGNIGTAVARIGMAFGMHVLVNRKQPGNADSSNPRFVNRETVLRSSDILSLHCPLTPETKHLINAESLAQMKQGSILLNTSRGPLVDENALVDALQRGHLAGAGLDVLGVEPPPPDNPLFHAKNCIITPHLAWASRASRSRLMDIAVANLRAFLANKPVNVVNGV